MGSEALTECPAEAVLAVSTRCYVLRGEGSSGWAWGVAGPAFGVASTRHQPRPELLCTVGLFLAAVRFSSSLLLLY